MKIIIFLFVGLFLCNNSFAQLKLPAIFGDNMVLQRNTLIKIWGNAVPGDTVFVIPEWGNMVQVTVDTNGKWICEIPTVDKGKTYKLTIKTEKETIKYKNILMGEVWICSGQSNMEMPLSGWLPNSPVLNSENEIKNSDYPDIRMFTVNRYLSVIPQENCKGEWVVCNPAISGSFSATAYFFGKELYKNLDVPIGLIHTSWGGTPVEAWINKPSLSTIESLKKALDNLETSEEKAIIRDNWLNSKPIVTLDNIGAKDFWERLDFNDKDCPEVLYNDSIWPEMNLPIGWESTSLGQFDGVVWFRKTIEIPKKWLNKNLTLELGPIDDMDAAFFNGQKIGGYERDGFWREKRKYHIPAALINKGKNVIAVRVIDNGGGGGLYGKPEDLKIYADEKKPVMLEGKWKYMPAAEYKNSAFYVMDINKCDFLNRPFVPIEISSHTPSLLFNAMINPLVPYRIKGAIWYQGESNTENPEPYKTLFPMLINNWRQIWGQGEFPFYYAQIAPYNYGIIQSQKIRDIQLQSLKVNNTGMAVTLDIGNNEDIHPANKGDVGKRLALWALAKTYGQNVCFSGPVYNSMKIESDKIIVNFLYAENGLVVKDNFSGEFLIAGPDKIFCRALVSVNGNQLILWNPKLKNPVAVRYAWSNTPKTVLFNKEGFPASSFRTDDWE